MTLFLRPPSPGPPGKGAPDRSSCGGRRRGEKACRTDHPGDEGDRFDHSGNAERYGPDGDPHSRDFGEGGRKPEKGGCGRYGVRIDRDPLDGSFRTAPVDRRSDRDPVPERIGSPYATFPVAAGSRKNHVRNAQDKKVAVFPAGSSERRPGSPASSIDDGGGSPPNGCPPVPKMVEESGRRLFLGP